MTQTKWSWIILFLCKLRIVIERRVILWVDDEGFPKYKICNVVIFCIVYVGKSKIISVKGVGIEPGTLGPLVLHSDAFLTNELDIACKTEILR